MIILKKKIISVLLALALLAASIPAVGEKTASAATALDANAGSGVNAAVSGVKGVNFDVGNIRYSGDIGNIKWGIDAAGVFAFYHSDATPQKRITNVSGFKNTYSAPTALPWYNYRSKIQYVTMLNLDSYISIPSMDYFFFECKNLKAVVMLPAVATSMNYTFYMNTKLQSIGCVLPQAQKMNYCFLGCSELESVVMTQNPKECAYTFNRTSCHVIVTPGIYDEKSRLAVESKCAGYHKMNHYELTLYGISLMNGDAIDMFKSDTCVSPIRYGQALSDAETGSTGGLRLRYSYGPNTFCHSVYIPCEITKLVKSPRNWTDVLAVGTYKDVLDIRMQATPAGVFNAIVPSSFYRTSYHSVVVEKCQLEVCTVGLSATAFVYDGTAKTPVVTLTNPYNQERLVKGKDYTVSFQNNVNAGTANVVITGMGNYTGSVSRNYTIQNANLSGGVTASGYSGIYDGNAHGIQVSVQKPSSGYKVTYGTSPGNCVLSASPTYQKAGTYTVYYQVSAVNYDTLTGSREVSIRAKDVANCSIGDIADETYDGKARVPEPVVSDGGKTLVKGTDYTVSYSNNTNAGTATVTVTGKGNYTGNKSRTFVIRPLTLQTASSGANGFVRPGSVVYSGKVQNPDISVVLGAGTVLLKEGADYVISGNTGVEAGMAKVSVTGKGNYTGTVSVSYPVTAFPMDGHGEKMILENEEMCYTGSMLCPGVTIRDTHGNVLEEGKDYSLQYTDAVNVGTAKVKAVFQGNYSGSITKSFYISPAVVTDVELPENEFVYNGKEHRPVAEGYHEGTDYTVSYRDNIKAGKALAIFSFQGNYTGTVTKEFVICPKKMEGEVTFPDAGETVYKPELALSEIALCETGNEYGSFRWENPDERVIVNNIGYLVRFSPYDLENYDWSGVPGWNGEEHAVICRIPLLVRKAQGKLPEYTVSCLAEGDLLGSAEISWSKEEGDFFWSDQKTVVSPDISSYALYFTPVDSENYDWSSVGEWEEPNKTCRLSCVLTVIANPEASCIRDGERLSSSLLSSGQEGASYEWENPDTVVTKAESGMNSYPAVYHYQGQSLVRMVAVPVWKEPAVTPGESVPPTGKPGESGKPDEPGGLKESTAPTRRPGQAPAETGKPGGRPGETPAGTGKPDGAGGLKESAAPSGKPGQAPSETGKPGELPAGTGKPGEAPTGTGRPDGTGTPGESAAPAGRPGESAAPTGTPGQTEQPEEDLRSGNTGLSAYEMIDKYILAKMLANDSMKKSINAVKTGKGKSSSKKAKIKVRWLVKRKTSIRMKKGTRLRLRIKGISKKKKTPWRSRKKKIVTINKKGVVTAKKTGSTRVVVKIGRKKYICKIQVRKK